MIPFICPNCGESHCSLESSEPLESELETMAERLLDLADSVLFPSSIVLSAEWSSELWLSRVSLALKLYRQAPALKIRAIAEDWKIHRIVQEVY